MQKIINIIANKTVIRVLQKVLEKLLKLKTQAEVLDKRSTVPNKNCIPLDLTHTATHNSAHQNKSKGNTEHSEGHELY